MYFFNELVIFGLLEIIRLNIRTLEFPEAKESPKILKQIIDDITQILLFIIISKFFFLSDLKIKIKDSKYLVYLEEDSKIINKDI